MRKQVEKIWLPALIVVTVLTIATAPAASAEPKNSDSPIAKLDTAINLIPADAAIYTSTLRGREQIEAIAASNAWKKLMGMPLVQMGWQFYEMQTADEDSVPGKINKALKDQQVQELLAMLGDMFSNEAFFYADASVIDTIELFQELNNINRFSPLMTQLDGGNGGLNDQQLKAKMLLTALAENPKLLKVPTIIMGFKLKDTQRAVAQLGKLDLIAGFALAQKPELADVYKRVELGGNSYSTFTVTGEMIPWHELPLDRMGNIESTPGDLDKVVEQVKKEKLVVALGLRDDYLMISIGPSTDVLENLGSGELLVDRPEIKRLGQFADKPVTGIGYASEKFNRAAAGSQEDIDELMAMAGTVLPSLGLEESDQEQIRKDAAALAEDIKPYMPQPGAVSGISFSSENGIEQYYFDWGKYPQADGSKPLGILKHVGGSPLLAFAARSKVSPQDYDLLVKWLKVAYGYVERFALPQMKPTDRQRFDKLAQALAPMVERLDTITREKLIPATSDGQAALVLDAKLMSKQIHKSLPEMAEPMPMIEPAVVLGISDENSFREAITQYWQLLGDTAGVLSETLPDKPDIELPEPKMEETEAGEIYSIELPEAAGLDEQIGLYLGLNESVAVFCLNKDQAKRLLADTALKAGGVLADANRARVKAVAFDWPQTLQVAMPWVEVGIKKAATRFMGPDDVNAQFQMFKPQLDTIVEVLSAVREITSESYMDDGVMVTHTLTKIDDIP